MDKIERIKSNIKAHKKELERINSLPNEARASKYVALQKLSLEKAIQKLSGKVQKLGGSIVESEPEKETIVITAQKKKKGSKKR